MISIGLFSTHLPYIILAMIYGAYFGINTILKMELQAEQDDKVLSVDIVKETKSQSCNTCYYTDFLTEAEGDLTNEALPHFQLIQRDYYQFKPPRSWFAGNLFSRPPPKLG